jgi:alpha-D-ribose 1-methylphosphonate 5-triphosphate diphosphatase
LQADGVGGLPDLWRLVSANPAAALGLADRGDIAVGRRADLVLLDWPEGHTPVVRHCFVNGRAAYGAIAMGTTLRHIP